MYAFRVALRRTPLAAAMTQATVPRNLGVRYCSSAAAVKASEIKKPEEICIRTEENVDVVRDAITKMLNKDEVDVKPISNEELESSLGKFAVRVYCCACQCWWRPPPPLSSMAFSHSHYFLAR